MADATRSQVITLVVLVVAFALATFLVVPLGSRADDDIRASTLLTGDHGAGALYQAMVTLGLPVERRHTPFIDADPLRGPLVMLSVGAVGLSRSEREGLVAWVRAGGTLMYAPGFFDPLTESLELGSHDPVFPNPFFAEPRVPAAPLPHAWTEGVNEVPDVASTFDELAEDLDHEVIIESAGGAPVVIAYRFGQGRVVALADQTLVSNETARAGAGALVVFVRAAADLAEPGDTIWFDEYHHGFAGGGSPLDAAWRFVADTGRGRALAQLAVLALALLYVVGRRFGAPRPPAPQRRRSPLEHVDALARVYRGAGARTTARRLLIGGLARRLREPHPAGDAETAALLDRLGRHPAMGPPAGRLAGVLAADGAPLDVAGAIDDIIDPGRKA
ncbi:MAG: DUF4350 domain-containing protein [Gemmatimonadota bacterium]